jgi:hypothetical protein
MTAMKPMLSLALVVLHSFGEQVAAALIERRQRWQIFEEVAGCLLSTKK